MCIMRGGAPDSGACSSSLLHNDPLVAGSILNRIFNQHGENSETHLMCEDGYIGWTTICKKKKKAKS